jgi:hypothetical protein
MNMDEGQERIIKMYYEEHKSQRDIARIEGRSLRDINGIIKAHRNKSDVTEPSNKIENGIKSGHNRAPKAYALFEKGHSQVQVAIKLEIDAKEAMQYYSDYLEMKGIGNLVTLHESLGNNGINSLVGIYYTMQTEVLVSTRPKMQSKKSDP